MHRLIIDTIEPLNAIFCEDLVAILGSCEVIPLSNDFCVVEGIKMNYSIVSFDNLLKFIQRYTNRAFLAHSQGDVDSQILLLQGYSANTLLCSFKPPEFFLWSSVAIDIELWYISPAQPIDL